MPYFEAVKVGSDELFTVRLSQLTDIEASEVTLKAIEVWNYGKERYI